MGTLMVSTCLSKLRSVTDNISNFQPCLSDIMAKEPGQKVPGSKMKQNALAYFYHKV
jgi:hypothetical protein